MLNDKGLVESIMAYSCTRIIYSHCRFIFVASNDMHGDHGIATVFFHDYQMACSIKQCMGGTREVCVRYIVPTGCVCCESGGGAIRDF